MSPTEAPDQVAADSRTKYSLLDKEPAAPPEMHTREEWKLACRIAASRGLAKSELLPRFLLYVCEQRLSGNTESITEQRIGAQIFNRASDYNPGEDNIVRSYARTLRKRLEEYFEGDGWDESMQITIPRGGYVPVFSAKLRVSRSLLEAPSPTLAEPPEGSSSVPALPDDAVKTVPEESVPSRRLSWLLPLLMGSLLGAALAASVLLFAAHKSKAAVSPSHALWSQIFQQDRVTLVIPADSGLGILQNLTGHLVTLEEYTNGTYPSQQSSSTGISEENLNDLRRQRYTSVVDLNIASTLTRLPEFNAAHAQLRYARSVTAEDLMNSNAVLIGSTHTNPWVSLFERQMNFTLEYTPKVDESFVVNKHPEGSEQPSYRNGAGSPTGAPNRTYGTIAYLRSLDGSGHVLIVQGLNMAATQAAADILFDAQAMKPILQQATRPDGTLGPFELLVETRSIGATAPGGQIIASRYLPRF